MSSPPPTSPPPMVWPPSPPGNVVPFPLPWGQTGCCPPGGMSSLMQCYNDIQAATAFICKVMVDCVNCNPAVVEAIIAAIEKSGSSLPLIGVTDGSNAQPGQVGEFIILEYNTGAYATGTSTQTISLGVLPPGDWDCWCWIFPSGFVTSVTYELNPTIAGASNGMIGNVFGSTPEGLLVPSPTARISVSVPTLIAFQVILTATAAGTFVFQFEARRAR